MSKNTHDVLMKLLSVVLWLGFWFLFLGDWIVKCAVSK